MGFYQTIQNQYGGEIVRNLKTWAKFNIKLASMRNRKIFLLNCRRLGIIPTHILNNTQNVNMLIDVQNGRTGQQVKNFTNRLKSKILSLEIKITHGDINRLEGILSQVYDKLENNLPNNILQEFIRLQNIKYNREFHKIKSTNINKLRNLEQQIMTEIKVEDNWLRNLTDIDIPGDIKTFLALGAKFCIPPDNQDISIPKFLADVEVLVSKVSNDKRNLFRARITNILTNFIHKPFKRKSFLNHLFFKTKKFLKEHPELIITKSDKGNVTVVMSKVLYKEKALEILNDEQNYIKLHRNPTSTIQQKANKLVHSLVENDLLGEQEGKKLMIYNAVPAKFYGLPKIHKPTLSVRPIISSIDTPNSKIAQYITNILTWAYDKDNPYYIKDSFDFSEFINEKQLPDNHVIISLDVISLFSNIPLELVKSSIQKRWELISPMCNMTYQKFIEVIEFIFDTTYFVYDGEYYKQILGTPMGATVSPIVAQMVMDDLLDYCVPKLSFQMSFLKKYVDDLICSIPDDGSDEILRIFNNYNCHIQFTIEKETNNSVPFLDTKLIRTQEQKVILDWYVKPTSSGRYINYNSYHSEKMKINLVLALKNRICRISHPSLKMANLEKLFNILLCNSYPRELLNKLLYNVAEMHGLDNSRDEQPQNENETTTFGSILYIKELSTRIMNLFKDEPIKIAYKNVKTVGQLFTKTKDKDNFLSKSGIVYSIPCHNCDSKYIGQTSRSLQSRIISHRSDCNNEKRSCALAEHVIDTGHHMELDNPSVLHQEKNLYKRLFLEMVEIHKETKNINKKTDISGLSTIYSYVLNIKQNAIENNYEDDDMSD